MCSLSDKQMKQHCGACMPPLTHRWSKRPYEPDPPALVRSTTERYICHTPSTFSRTLAKRTPTRPGLSGRTEHSTTAPTSCTLAALPSRWPPAPALCYAAAAQLLAPSAQKPEPFAFLVLSFSLPCSCSHSHLCCVAATRTVTSST